jgi:Cytochrome bd terminal oxidase subunit I
LASSRTPFFPFISGSSEIEPECIRCGERRDGFGLMAIQSWVPAFNKGPLNWSGGVPKGQKPLDYAVIPKGGFRITRRHIFGVAFGLGVVSGVVMAFQFGTNWSVLSKMSGPIQGPLLSYETFTAFALEASFFGVLLFGRSRVPPWFYLFSTAMVALGTTLSAFWIMVNNSWMQVPVGYVVQNGAFVPDDSFPLPFIAVLTGWYTAEVGRQPWVAYRVLRRNDAVLDRARGSDLTRRLLRHLHVHLRFRHRLSCGLARPDI